MLIIKFLLFPFSVLYDLVTTIRNKFYDWNIFKTHRFPVKLISVGNLTVGGTGKSPVVEHLVRLLSQQSNICTLSRGYGRKSKGFYLAGPDSTAESIGDEPLQFYLKFSSQIKVAVGEKRASAIDKIIASDKNVDLIILDDAYQHRAVKPDYSILVTDYNRLFFKDFLLPAGRLRESAKGAARADLIIVSKCPPSVNQNKKAEIIKVINKYTQKPIPVYFTGIQYNSPVSFTGQSKLVQGQKVIGFSGIARPEAFYDYLKKHYQVVKEINFPDHYNYTINDIKGIFETGNISGESIAYLTTEKDMVRLLKKEFSGILPMNKLFYIPIQIEFMEGEGEFGELIKKAVGL